MENMRYPLMVKLAGRRVLVVGAGAVAERKIEGLLPTGAEVIVTALDASPRIQRWAGQARLEWRERAFRPEDLDGAVLAFAATDVTAVNRAVADEARKRGIPVNAADDPEGSDIHLPAVLWHGGVTVTVSTDGGSPALAAWLRDRIGRMLPDRVDRLAAVCRELRAGLDEERKKEGTALFGAFFASGAPEAVLEGDDAAAERAVDAIFGSGAWRRAAGDVTEE